MINNKEIWFDVTMRDLNGIPVTYHAKALNRDESVRKVMEVSRFTFDDLIGVEEILDQECYIG